MLVHHVWHVLLAAYGLCVHIGVLHVLNLHGVHDLLVSLARLRLIIDVHVVVKLLVHLNSSIELCLHFFSVRVIHWLLGQLTHLLEGGLIGCIIVILVHF